ncbi:MAG TPA: 4-hydroxythreonine-4-phosphate dehydrogenase PdxA, partial [Pyrinomonadaceae bacterium]|nr:4-hydroxythreonine-4-phosphate dehydrogenase PdxA [Pyrinomonadaceae bacterium]
MTGWLGISLGDITGVGPEVALKAVAAESKNDDTKYLFIGDEQILARLNEKFSLNLPLKRNSGDSGRFFTTNPFLEKFSENLPAGSPGAANAAMAYLRDGANRCLRGELDGIVTAPVNKEAIVRAGHKNFVGQTEFLSDLAKAKRTAMMLLGHDAQNRWLRVALTTIHISIKSVPEKLTADKISLAVEL